MATKTKKTPKIEAREDLRSFDDWTPEEKQAWAAKQLGSEEQEPMALVEELFPDDDEVSVANDLLLEAEDPDVDPDANPYVDHEDDEDGESGFVFVPGRVNPKYEVTEAGVDRLSRLLEAYDSIKTVQGIISISRVTTTKREGWMCIHRQLMDKEGDAQVTTTSTTTSPEVGNLFNLLVPHLIELGGLDRVVWKEAEITKVSFPVKVGDKTSNLVVSGVNPGAYGKQKITSSVVFVDAPPATREIITHLGAQVSVWLEQRILEAKREAEKRPIQMSLLEMAGE